jgi:hypothetical protein
MVFITSLKSSFNAFLPPCYGIPSFLYVILEDKLYLILSMYFVFRNPLTACMLNFRSSLPMFPMYLGYLIQRAIYCFTLPVHALWFILLVRSTVFFHSLYSSDFNCSEANETEYSHVIVGWWT